MARVRNYRAEYQRRLERGKVLRLPKSVARGHASKYTYGIREAAHASRISHRPIRAGQSKIRHTGKSVDEATFEASVRELVALGISRRRAEAIDIHDEAAIIRAAIDAGLTPNEAYTLRFSP